LNYSNYTTFDKLPRTLLYVAILLFITPLSFAQYGNEFIDGMIVEDSKEQDSIVGHDKGETDETQGSEEDKSEYFEGVDMDEYLRLADEERRVEQNLRSKHQEEEDDESFVVITFILCSLAFWSLVFIHHKIKYKGVDIEWADGLFPEGYVYSRDTLMEAYLRLAAMMMRHDKEDFSQKIGFVHSYFRKHFPEEVIDFKEILNAAYRHPVKLNSAAKWLKKHLSSAERIQVLYFLAGLSVVDGDFNPKEKVVIIELSNLLTISRKDLDSILNMYASYEWKNRQKEQSKRAKTYSKSQSERKIEEYSRILGVSAQAGIVEIKKAYRSLVKLHHPDRFANKSKAQQKLANDRFLVVQEAYEYLEKIK
jgi:DnaJ like chaperone protein